MIRITEPSPRVPQRASLGAWIASVLAGLGIGLAIWLPGVTESPYRGDLRFAAVCAAVCLALFAASKTGRRHWMPPIAVGGGLAAMAPFFYLVLVFVLSGVS